MKYTVNPHKVWGINSLIVVHSVNQHWMMINGNKGTWPQKVKKIIHLMQ
jgi:hypothetical protein